MKPTCLIVDDHEVLRNLLCDWLQSVFSQIEFIGAPDGEAALELVRQRAPGVVVMDIGLPGMNGLEATRQIKQGYPQTFVIIHSIHNDQAYRSDAELAGADVYISKNKTQSDLVPALVKAFLPVTEGNQTAQ